MKFDYQTFDTASLLRDAYHQVSWTQDAMLSVLSDYLDSYGSLPHFAHYISQRVQEESGSPLYDNTDPMAISLPCPSGGDNRQTAFVLPADSESFNASMGTANVRLQKNAKGLLVEVYSLDRPGDGVLDSMLTDWDEFVPAGMKIVNVHALLQMGKPHELDKEVPGVYRIALPDDEQDIAGTALDIFHNTIAVKCLDNFEFKVIDDQGIEFQEGEDYEAHSGIDKGIVIRKL